MQVGATNLINFGNRRSCQARRHHDVDRSMRSRQYQDDFRYQEEQQPQEKSQEQTSKPAQAQIPMTKDEAEIVEKAIGVIQENLQSAMASQNASEYSNDEAESIGKVVEAMRKANGDVSIATCAMGAAAFVIALKSGCKVAAIARRAAAMFGETASKSAVKLASKVKKSIDIEKADKAINTFFTKMKDDIPGNSERFTERFESVINALVAKKKPEGGYVENVGEKVTQAANKIGLYFKAPLAADFTVASLIAIPTATEAAKTTENAIDKHNIKSSAFENLKFMKDTANLIRDLTDGIVY